ncbi:MAG: LysM peptidoglycan-binding domain-containing protein [Pseudomonadota bacterium]
MKRALPIAVALFVIGAGAVLHFAYGVNSPDDLVTLIEGGETSAQTGGETASGDDNAASDNASANDQSATASDDAGGTADGITEGDTSATAAVQESEGVADQDRNAAVSKSAADESTSKETAEQFENASADSSDAENDSGSQEVSSASDPSNEQTAALPATQDADEALDTLADESQGAATMVPSFDLVRVESSGESVIAGRAAPFSTVRIYDGDVMIGETQADSTGSWVLLPEDLLSSGNHSLTVVALAEDGSEIRSEQVAVVVVPELRLASDALGDKSLTPEDPLVPASVPTEGEELAQLPEAGAELVEEALEAGDKLEPEEPLVVLLSEDEGQASQVLQGTQRSDDAGIRQDGLILESIDYTSEGGSVIAGQAPAGTRIVLYMDNEVVGYATADENGRWRIELASGVEPGLHVLRVDQVDEDGTVIARVETPYSQPDALPEDSLDVAQIVVQPGNSLWRISRRSYGKGVLYSVIFEANRDQIRDPDLIYPGQIFAVPRVE